jgi:NAD(P)-dependent dehydrogenase (short-subunit alcohol dehydrogenase family)
MGRFGEPEELVGAAVFLAAHEASSVITGTDLCVDGGFLAKTV